MAPDRREGLHQKFYVTRLDGDGNLRDDKPNARYFVLDYGNDPHAQVALSAYAESVHRENDTLARDLRQALVDLPPHDGSATPR